MTGRSVPLHARRRSLCSVLWPDHLTCPDLERWLPIELEGCLARTHVAPESEGWRLPAALRPLSRLWPGWSEDDVDLGAFVHFGLLQAGVSPRLLSTLMPGGRFVEVATLARPLRTWVRPWTWRRDASRHAPRRVVEWSRAGLFELEQYIALAPLEAVVTLGRAAPRDAEDAQRSTGPRTS